MSAIQEADAVPRGGSSEQNVSHETKGPMPKQTAAPDGQTSVLPGAKQKSVTASMRDEETKGVDTAAAPKKGWFGEVVDSAWQMVREPYDDVKELLKEFEEVGGRSGHNERAETPAVHMAELQARVEPGDVEAYDDYVWGCHSIKNDPRYSEKEQWDALQQFVLDDTFHERHTCYLKVDRTIKGAAKTAKVICSAATLGKAVTGLAKGAAKSAAGGAGACADFLKEQARNQAWEKIVQRIGP